MNRDHPIYKLKQVLLRKESRLTLEFSRYVYVSYGVTLSREIFHIKGSDILHGWLEDQIEILSEGQELAFHSRVKIHEDSNIFHIPMIDFVNTKSASKIISKISPLNEILDSNLVLYESGNSFHGYFFQLLKQAEWHEFLGRALLCNPPSRFNDDIVDSRWVGHSLVHGFSALRWSKKTEKYKIVPKLSRKTKTKSVERSMFDIAPTK